MVFRFAISLWRLHCIGSMPSDKLRMDIGHCISLCVVDTGRKHERIGIGVHQLVLDDLIQLKTVRPHIALYAFLGRHGERKTCHSECIETAFREYLM